MRPRGRHHPSSRSSRSSVSLHSFSGGVGKTHIAAALAVSRRQAGYEVVVIDADLSGLGHLRTLYQLKSLRLPSGKAPDRWPSFWSLVSGPAWSDHDFAGLLNEGQHRGNEGQHRGNKGTNRALIRLKLPAADLLKQVGRPDDYWLLPNFPLADPFPANVREVTLGAYYTARLAGRN